MFFLNCASPHVIIVVVVNDMLFVSNSTALMNTVKQNLSTTFNFKLFSELQTLIGWNIKYLPDGIKVTQSRYGKDLLARCGLETCIAVWSPLPTIANLTSAHDCNLALNPKEHS